MPEFDPCRQQHDRDATHIGRIEHSDQLHGFVRSCASGVKGAEAAIVDASADRVRREAPWFTGIAAAKTSAVSDRAYSSARTAHSSLVR